MFVFFTSLATASSRECFLSLFKFEREHINAVIISRFHISGEGGGGKKSEIWFSFSIFNLLVQLFQRS